MDIVLNEKQSIIADEIKDWLMSNANITFLISGPGGSGKTALVANVLQQLPYRVMYCAFTNKAVSVLRARVKGECSTIHRMLKLEPNNIDMNNKKTIDILQMMDNKLRKNLYNYGHLIKTLA
jgi:cytidylate kinase